MEFLKLLWLIVVEQLAWTAEMSVTGVSEIDAAIPEYWADGIMPDADRESFWGSLSGAEGSMMPCIKKTGKLKEKGDKLTFNTIAQLMGSGVTGESVLKGQEEKLAIGSFTVSADYVRHAVGISKKATKQGNFQVVQDAGKLLKQWMTRKLDNDAFTSITGSGSVETLYANGKSAVSELNATDGDAFGPNEIELMRMALIRQGATPLKVVKQNGRSLPLYGIVYGEIEDYRLSMNSTFNQAIREGLERYSRGGDHPLFQGAIGVYRNVLLYPYYSILPIPQGTPLRPETLVYATLVTSATTLSVGGSSTAQNYTLFFASSGSLQIGDEIISYAAKTANSFTGLTRGVSGTTDAQHVPNALVTQRNISTVIGFGAEALFRAIPEEATPIGEKDDYGAQIGLGIEAYFGQAVKIDARRTKAQNVVMMKCYSANPGTV